MEKFYDAFIGFSQNNQEKSGSAQKPVARGSRKSRASTRPTSQKTETSPNRQSLISKIMALQKQSPKLAPKSEKPLRPADDKVTHWTSYDEFLPFLLSKHSHLYLPDYENSGAGGD